MKKDLYRFAKARRYGERIKLVEGEWWVKYNNEVMMSEVIRMLGQDE